MKVLIIVLAALTALVAFLFMPLPVSRERVEVWKATPRTVHSFDEEADRDRFARRIRRMLDQERFEDIERMADSLEAADARWLSGAPKLVTLVQRGLGKVEDPKDGEQWIALLERLRTWRDVRPKSRWPDVGIAEALASRGYAARGTGIALTVSADEHRRMVRDLDEARRVLLQSRTARATGPLWYDTLLRTEHGLGAPGDARFRTVLREAVETYPHYHRFLVQAANHLLPRWYGEPGELAEFGETLAHTLPDSVANEYYARMAAGLVAMYGPSIFDEAGFSWERTRQGLEDWRQRWPDSTQPPALLAMLATMSGDLAYARLAFHALGDTIDVAVWKNRPRYDELRGIAFMDSLAAN